MAKEKTTKYHLSYDWDTPYSLAATSDQRLKEWAADPDCIENESCAKILTERIAKREEDAAALRGARTAKREELQENPFDPRTEVSADAKHIAGQIVKHLWILFVLLPIVAVLLLALIDAVK
jgi:hypothetical protein